MYVLCTLKHVLVLKNHFVFHTLYVQMHRGPEGDLDPILRPGQDLALELAVLAEGDGGHGEVELAGGGVGVERAPAADVPDHGVGVACKWIYVKTEWVLYSMETCLCRQTLKIKDLYQICIYFCEKWFKLKVKPCRIIALKDFWIELIIYWEPTIRIYSYSCIKSVFSSTVKHNFGSILVSSIRYSLIGYVCITH